MISESTLVNSLRSLPLLKRVTLHPFFLFLLPVLLILVNSRWLFIDLTSTIDPWVYLGYSIDLKQHLNAFYGTYYGTRLPWILPGFLAYQFFSPLVAKYILHLTFYYAAIFSLFGILKKTVGLRAAFLTAILMELYLPFLLEFGSHYISGAGIAYLLLTMFMLTCSQSKKYPQLHLLLAGVFCSCFLFTQLFLVIFIPLLLMYYAFLNRPHSLTSCLTNLGFFILGFLGITLFFCSINYFLTGSFHFYGPIFNWTKSFVKHENNWILPFYLWDWDKLSIISILLVTLFGSAVTLFFQTNLEKHPRRNFILFFNFYFVINLAVFMLIDFVWKQPVLQFHFYICYLLPALFLSIGSGLSFALNKLEGKYYYILLIITVIGGLYGYLKDVDSSAAYTHTILISIFVIGTLGMISLHLKKRFFPLIGMTSLIIAFFLTNVFFSPMKGVSFGQLKSVYHSIFYTIQATKEMDPTCNSLFWYNKNISRISGVIFKSISSSYLWGYRLVNEEFPSIDSKHGLHLPDLTNKNVFILSTPREHPLEEANKSLATIGFRGELLKEVMVEEKDTKLKITHMHVVKHPNSEE